MQQRDAGAGAALHLGHEHHRATIAATTSHQHLSVAGHPALRSEQLRVPLDPAGYVTRQAAAIDDRDRRRAAEVTLDAVAGEADHRLDGRVEIGEDLEGAVAEPITAGPGSKHCLHQRPVEHAFVVATDADGDGLGLMLDRVDGAGELLDRTRERSRHVVDQHARCGHRAGHSLIHLERLILGQIAQQRREANRRRGLEVPVVDAGVQPVEEPLAVRTYPVLHEAEDLVRIAAV